MPKKLTRGGHARKWKHGNAVSYAVEAGVPRAEESHEFLFRGGAANKLPYKSFSTTFYATQSLK